MLARLRITTRINLTLLLGVIGTLIVVSIGYSIMRVQMMDERGRVSFEISLVWR